MAAELDEGFRFRVRDAVVEAMLVGIGDGMEGSGIGGGVFCEFSEGVVEEVDEGVGVDVVDAVTPLAELHEHVRGALRVVLLESDFEELLPVLLCLVLHVVDHSLVDDGWEGSGKARLFEFRIGA